MEMDMSIYKFSLLTNNQHLVFNPDVDILKFDSASITASNVRLLQSGANLGFTYGGKTVWLDATVIGELSVATNANVTFANGSVLAIGDGTSYTLADYYGQDYTLSTSTVGNQVWGLGGADIVQAGSGGDWLVGNVALTSLNHVSRVGTAGAPTGSDHATISADGRFVAFEGGWTSFGSTNNNSTDVIVKDMVIGSAANEHENSGGTNGNSGSGAPVISADGTVLAFLSASSNLVAGPASSALYDIYLSDVGGNGIGRVSTGTGGTLAANGRSLNPDLSGDGRYIVFESTTSNWASGGSTATTDIFLKDRFTGTLTRISTSLTGGDGNGESINAKVSADGRYVVFESAASNLTTGDTNGYTDIFVWDSSDGSLTNLSDLDPAATRNPNNSSNAADIAYDGGWGGVIVFQTAKALVAKDTANNTDIYAYDFRNPDAPAFKLVSSTAAGAGVQLGSEDASVSGDGRFVVFTSYSDALVAGDSNGTRDIFVKDLNTGAIALVSKSAAGVVANGPSTHAQISLGGEWIVFESSATNLASTDGNGTFTDVFRVSNPLLKDTLIGGAGNDTYVLDRADIVQEQVNGGIDTILSSISYSLVDTDGGGTFGGNVENLTLSGTANLNGTGNALNNVIKGNAGNNVMNGGTGIDTVSYAAATAAVTVSLVLTTAQATGGAGSDTITNFENITGSAFADSLTGNTGNNRIDGGVGNDTLTGGTGNDTYVVDAAGDVIVETGTATTEIDSVSSSVSWTLGARLENLTLTGTSAINGGGNTLANTITGNAAANTLNGYAGNDTLNGGSGNDTLNGSTGNDTYVVDAAGDVIVESGTATTEIDSVSSSVSWTLGARLENLTLTGTSAINGGGNTLDNILTGNSANNTLTGGSGNDTLNGGAGNDTLIGSAGSDRLTGGTGGDVFVLNSTVGSDTITDFVSGTDDLRINQSALRIGDGDLLVEGAFTRAAPGGFSAGAELVIFSANLASLSATAAAAAIGSAASAYIVGAHALFGVDNGTSSQLYLFTAADANAQVSAGELTLLGTLNGTASTTVGDYLFGA
jgi:Ca2+-binding RTX toxin-like protein